MVWGGPGLRTSGSGCRCGRTCGSNSPSGPRSSAVTDSCLIRRLPSRQFQPGGQAEDPPQLADQRHWDQSRVRRAQAIEAPLDDLLELGDRPAVGCGLDRPANSAASGCSESPWRSARYAASSGSRSIPRCRSTATGGRSTTKLTGRPPRTSVSALEPFADDRVSDDGRDPGIRERSGDQTRVADAQHTGRLPRPSGARYRGRRHREPPIGSQARSVVASHRRRRARRAGAVA